MEPARKAAPNVPRIFQSVSVKSPRRSATIETSAATPSRVAALIPKAAQPPHQALAVVFAFFSAFCAMNFSVASYASSSTICTGGDFIR